MNEVTKERRAFLAQIEACLPARDWILNRSDKSEQQLWDEVPRVEWRVWYACRYKLSVVSDSYTMAVFSFVVTQLLRFAKVLPVSDEINAALDWLCDVRHSACWNPLRFDELIAKPPQADRDFEREDMSWTPTVQFVRCVFDLVDALTLQHPSLCAVVWAAVLTEAAIRSEKSGNFNSEYVNRMAIVVSHEWSEELREQMPIVPKRPGT